MKKILALILALTLMLPLVSCKKKKTEEEVPPIAPEVKLTPLFDLDLSEYIEIDEQYYKGFDIEIKVNTVTDAAVDELVEYILDNNKILLSGEDQIAIGYELSIFYKGYYLDDNDKLVEIEGSSNWDDAGGDIIEIGAGNFIPGFDEALISTRPCDYSKENPLVIEVQFPDNYDPNPDLAGLEAYFNVAVEVLDGQYQIFARSDLNETFIKQTLGYTDEELAEYDGDTVVDRFLSILRHTLKWENVNLAKAARTELDKLVWDHVVIKKYPEDHLKQKYNEIVKAIEAEYNAYPALKKDYTLDQYACVNFGVPTGSDWRRAAEDKAKDELKIELLIYYIFQKEGLKPEADEYARLVDEYFDSVLYSSGMPPESFNTEAEYLAYRENEESKYIASYGEESLKAIIYQNLWIEAIISYANIIEITE